MPSDRRVVAYRPDDEENEMLKRLTKKYGLSMARVLGMAVRQMAEREGIEIEEKAETSS